MAQRGPIDWDAIRAAHTRGLNDEEIGRQFRVSSRSVRGHRAADAVAGTPWPAPAGGVATGRPRKPGNAEAPPAGAGSAAVDAAAAAAGLSPSSTRALQKVASRLQASVDAARGEVVGAPALPALPAARRGRGGHPAVGFVQAVRGDAPAPSAPSNVTPIGAAKGAAKGASARGASSSGAPAPEDAPPPRRAPVQNESLPPIEFELSTATDAAIAEAMRAASLHALQLFQRGEIEPGMNQSVADVLASLVASGQRSIAASRDVAGKKAGVPSGEAVDTGPRKLTIKRERIETVKVNVDDKGRLIA